MAVVGKSAVAHPFGQHAHIGCQTQLPPRFKNAGEARQKLGDAITDPIVCSSTYTFRDTQSIIDFIEQHHGTTLVEYFYRREAQRLRDDPDAGELDETTFRYPGPKPQTKEGWERNGSDVPDVTGAAFSKTSR